uniref:Uncharacterized protein n=1 Tax=Caulobacter sp. (strain K31) TaxID=366602 RepID=B0SY73_CAUSK
MTLTPGQFTALSNLQRKKAGEAVDWINISDARALTELGFAERTGGGWVITPAGTTVLLVNEGDQQK